MWILIITLVTTTGVGVGSLEFTSDKMCNEAGEKWVGSVSATFRDSYFVCVKKDLL